jgi:zinc and cadmium transporter
MTLLWIVVSTILISLISLIGIVTTLRSDIQRLTFYFISFASGTMLGGAFLDLLPEALESGEPVKRVLGKIAAGVVLFFLFEKLLIWRHCHLHQYPDDHHRPTAANMVLAGDAVHNLIDGMIVANAYMTNLSLGFTVTVAIIFHEIPQELGDFGVLVHGGYPVRKALAANLATGLTALLGAVLTYFFVGAMPFLKLFLLPMTAGGFLYIALADLIPQLHVQVAARQTVGQIILFALGFGMMGLIGH